MEISFGVLSGITNCLMKIFPKSYQHILIPYCYQQQLDVIKQIAGKISEEYLEKKLAQFFETEKAEVLNIQGKSEIMRLIHLVKDLLALIEKQSSLLDKILPKGDENIDVLRNHLSNEWLWLIALYLLQDSDADLAKMVKKHNLLKNIQHLNEFSLEEFAALPNGCPEVFAPNGINTEPPKGILFLKQERIQDYLIQIRSQFLPQE